MFYTWLISWLPIDPTCSHSLFFTKLKSIFQWSLNMIFYTSTSPIIVDSLRYNLHIKRLTPNCSISFMTYKKNFIQLWKCDDSLDNWRICQRPILEMLRSTIRELWSHQLWLLWRLWSWIWWTIAEIWKKLSILLSFRLKIEVNVCGWDSRTERIVKFCPSFSRTYSLLKYIIEHILFRFIDILIEKPSNYWISLRSSHLLLLSRLEDHSFH